MLTAKRVIIVTVCGFIFGFYIAILGGFGGLSLTREKIKSK